MRRRIHFSRRRWNLRLLILALAVVLLLMALVFGIRACMQKYDRYTTVVYGVPVHTALIPEGNVARPGITRTIKYVVLHETGNTQKGSNAAAHSTFLLYNNTSTTSWHYTVDDHEIYHHIPDHEVAWHASDQLTDPGGNLNGIGVELCVNEDGDFEKTFDNAARLVAYLLQEYDLDLEDIKQHADFVEKNCPERIRNENRMEEFRNLVASYMQQGSTEQQKETDTQE